MVNDILFLALVAWILLRDEQLPALRRGGRRRPPAAIRHWRRLRDRRRRSRRGPRTGGPS
jgi:hypothetical protein